MASRFVEAPEGTPKELLYRRELAAKTGFVPFTEPISLAEYDYGCMCIYNGGDVHGLLAQRYICIEEDTER